MYRDYFPSLGVGIGLRPPHFDEILSGRPKVGWFEAISENFLGIEGGTGARPLHILEEIREHYPVVLHGVSLSIGSTDPLDRNYLERLKALANRVNPAWVSDHLCWTGVDGENLHDLLPLPYSREAIAHIVPRVRAVQDILGRRLILENVSTYLTFRSSEMTEWEFLAEVAEQADCGLLLDVNNIYVTAQNNGFDPLLFLRGIPRERVVQMHLAGHSVFDTHLLDTHDAPVCDAVWKLYREAIRAFGEVSTLIEWDDNIPDFSVLQAEAAKAEAIVEECLGR